MWECKNIGCPFDDGENCLHEGSCVLDKKDHVHPYIKDAFDKIRADAIDEFVKPYIDTYDLMKQNENGREPYVFVRKLIDRAKWLKERAYDV